MNFLNITIKFFIFFLILYLWIFTTSGICITLNLEDCIKIALKRNFYIKSLEFKSKNVREELKKAEYSFLPKVNIRPSIGWFSGSLQFLMSSEDMTVYYANESNRETDFFSANLILDIEWPLFKEGSFLGINSISKKIAKTGIQIVDLEKQIIQQQVVEKTIDVYLDVFINKKQFELSNENLRFAKSLLDEARDKFQQNLISIVEFDEVKTFYNNALLNFKKFQISYDLALESLKHFLDLDQDINIDDNLKINFKLPPFSEIRSKITHNLFIKMTHLQVDQQFLFSKKEKFNLFPTVSINFDYLYQFRNDNFIQDVYVAFCRMDWSFDLELFKEIRASYYQYKYLEQQFNAINKDLEVDIYHIYNEILELQTYLKELENQLKFQKEKIDIYKQKFEIGLLNITELLDVQRGLIDIQKEIIKNKAILFKNVVLLKHKIGIPWNESFENGNF